MIAIKGDREILERLNPEGYDMAYVSLAELRAAIDNKTIVLIDGNMLYAAAIEVNLPKVTVRFWKSSGLFVRVGTVNRTIEDLTAEEFMKFKEGKGFDDAWRWVDKLRKAIKELL